MTEYVELQKELLIANRGTQLIMQPGTVLQVERTDGDKVLVSLGRCVGWIPMDDVLRDAEDLIWKPW